MPENNLYPRLAELSERAHKAAKQNDETKVKEIEDKIDGLSAEIWGLTDAELNDIKLSLEEIR